MLVPRRQWISILGHLAVDLPVISARDYLLLYLLLMMLDMNRVCTVDKTSFGAQ
jgi:hypothetical protein